METRASICKCDEVSVSSGIPEGGSLSPAPCAHQLNTHAHQRWATPAGFTNKEAVWEDTQERGRPGKVDASTDLQRSPTSKARRLMLLSSVPVRITRKRTKQRRDDDDGVAGQTQARRVGQVPCHPWRHPVEPAGRSRARTRSRCRFPASLGGRPARRRRKSTCQRGWWRRERSIIIKCFRRRDGGGFFVCSPQDCKQCRPLRGTGRGSRRW